MSIRRKQYAKQRKEEAAFNAEHKNKVTLAAAQATDRTQVVVIKHHRLHGVPGYESGWEVAVPEVSKLDAVRAVREEYEEMRTKERYFLE